VTELLEAVLASAPPEAAVSAPPWRLHRSPGGCRRQIAATLRGPLAPGAVAGAMAAMWGWDQRPVFLVREDEAALDGALAAEGLAVEAPTLLFAARPAPAERADPAVVDCDGMIAIATELWAEAGEAPARLAAMSRVAAPRRFLIGRLDNRPAAAAFLSRHGDAAALDALQVAPWARRRGVGRRLLRWAAAWAAADGAASLAVAAEAADEAALAFCRGLGMAEAGRFHFRAAEA
jgi:N-acetylglutamate synthase